MHAQRCGFSLGKVLLQIVANLQKDRFCKKGFQKSFEIFWKIMTISSQGFFCLKMYNGISPKGFEKGFLFKKNYNGNFYQRI